ncbi:MAG: hypothetical protein HC903_03410 [Methylacidiphilales bacterium]|nr:hypothetical protein [Candidatus Methylacidiphilales bacterium]
MNCTKVKREGEAGSNSKFKKLPSLRYTMVQSSHFTAIATKISLVVQKSLET